VSYSTALPMSFTLAICSALKLCRPAAIGGMVKTKN
jgi:hypothetical protein